MRKLLLIVAALLVVASGSASAASASMWSATPAGGTFTGAAGLTRLVDGTVNATCTGSAPVGKMTGTGDEIVTGPASPAAWNAVATITPRFGDVTHTCTAAGLTLKVSCNRDITGGSDAFLNATSSTATTSTNGSTLGYISAIDCNLSETGATCLSVTGSVNVKFNNASSTLIVFTTGQHLTGTVVTSCLGLAAGSVRFDDGADGNVSYNVVGTPHHPAIWD